MEINGEIATTIRAALAEYVKQDTASIRPDHDLRADLGLDSVAIIELLYKLEEVFDMQIPDQDLEQLRTVGDVMTYVQRTVPGATPRQPMKSKPSVRPSSPRKKPKR